MPAGNGNSDPIIDPILYPGKFTWCWGLRGFQQTLPYRGALMTGLPNAEQKQPYPCPFIWSYGWGTNVGDTDLPDMSVGHRKVVTTGRSTYILPQDTNIMLVGGSNTYWELGGRWEDNCPHYFWHSGAGFNYIADPSCVAAFGAAHPDRNPFQALTTPAIVRMQGFDGFANGAPILDISAGGDVWGYTTGGQSFAQGGSVLMCLTNGTVMGWGANADGQLGAGDFLPRHNGNFNSATFGFDLNSVFSGYAARVHMGGKHGLIMDSNGNIYSAGNNDYGQLGRGTIGISDPNWVPVEVPAGYRWIDIAAGPHASLMLATDDRLLTYLMYEQDTDLLTNFPSFAHTDGYVFVPDTLDSIKISVHDREGFRTTEQMLSIPVGAVIELEPDNIDFISGYGASFEVVAEPIDEGDGVVIPVTLLTGTLLNSLFLGMNYLVRIIIDTQIQEPRTATYVWGVGDGSHGELGSIFAPTETPVLVAFRTNVVEIMQHGRMSWMRCDDGRLYTLGQFTGNYPGGRIKSSTAPEAETPTGPFVDLTNASSPVRVFLDWIISEDEAGELTYAAADPQTITCAKLGYTSGMSDAMDDSPNDAPFYAVIGSNGMVYTWGGNRYGTLGNNTRTDPVPQTGLALHRTIFDTHVAEDDGNLTFGNATWVTVGDGFVSVVADGHIRRFDYPVAASSDVVVNGTISPTAYPYGTFMGGGYDDSYWSKPVTVPDGAGPDDPVDFAAYTAQPQWWTYPDPGHSRFFVRQYLYLPDGNYNDDPLFGGTGRFVNWDAPQQRNGNYLASSSYGANHVGHGVTGIPLTINGDLSFASTSGNFDSFFPGWQFIPGQMNLIVWAAPPDVHVIHGATPTTPAFSEDVPQYTTNTVLPRGFGVGMIMSYVTADVFTALPGTPGVPGDPFASLRAKSTVQFIG